MFWMPWIASEHFTTITRPIEMLAMLVLSCFLFLSPTSALSCLLIWIFKWCKIVWDCSIILAITGAKTESRAIYLSVLLLWETAVSEMEACDELSLVESWVLLLASATIIDSWNITPPLHIFQCTQVYSHTHTCMCSAGKECFCTKEIRFNREFCYSLFLTGFPNHTDVIRSWYVCTFSLLNDK